MNRKDRYLDRLCEVPLLQGLNRKDLLTLGRQADTHEASPGQVVVAEGERGEEFFVVMSGSLLATRRGQEVATLGKGDFFGELALFDPAPRDATVTALTHAELLAVDARHFQPLLQDVPLLARRVISQLAHRLRDADSNRSDGASPSYRVHGQPAQVGPRVLSSPLHRAARNDRRALTGLLTQ